MFKNWTEVGDAVSVVVKCPDDATLMLIADQFGVLWLPSAPVTKKCWKSSVKNLLHDTLGIDQKSVTLLALTRFWNPDSCHSIYHVVYKLTVSIEVKRDINSNDKKGDKRWVAPLDLMSLWNKKFLRSPELLTYLCGEEQCLLDACSVDRCYKKNGNLVEIDKEDVLVNVDAFSPSSNEEFIASAGFSLLFQRVAYKEFLMATMPCLFMGEGTFYKYMEALEWSAQLWPRLFWAADVNERGMLSFREFLSFLACIEPNTPHSGASAELRSRYIFRYYDTRKVGRLDFENFKLIVSDVQANATKTALDNVTYEKELDACAMDMGMSVNSNLLLEPFLQSLGGLKFRGASKIMRSKMSFIRFINMIRARRQGNTAFVDDSRTSARDEERSMKPSGLPASAYLPKDGKTMLSVQPILSSAKKTVEADFELAGHTIKVARTGLMAEVRTLQQVHSGVSPSLIHDIDSFVRGKSRDVFNSHALPNDLLSKLNAYVALSNDKKHHKGSKGKEGSQVPQSEAIAFARCLITACKFAVEVFRQEPRLLKIDSPVYIMGDLHGNYPCLANFENVMWRLGPMLTPCNLLFLGDYVDRGSQCVEVVAYLIAHKLKCTHKVFLIRGNHEIRELQRNFTFPQECCTKFGGEVGQEVWRSVNDVFDTLPLAAVVDGKVFCCHGGIPPPWLCPMINTINTIPCPLAIDNEKTNPLAWDLMWNDPIRSPRVAENTMIELRANSGFAANIRRRTGHIFTVGALEKFLLANGLSHVVRAHEAQDAGYQIHQKGKLLTVFSSAHYSGGRNEAACVLAEKNRLRVFRLEYP